jgi:hypothetical protein
LSRLDPLAPHHISRQVPGMESSAIT